MMNPAIQVEGLGKRYRLGVSAQQDPLGQHYGTLRETVTGLASLPLRLVSRLGRRMPGVGTRRASFWALRDVGFEVKHGEVVGIIGRNGAGKSTLLKILSEITEPTEGRIRIAGRVASLLEVGTGFHPELTGRENIFLNGAIMGMTHAEIIRKFDEIVAFAEIEQFLDTQVKHYSSGMYMRLAFAVAAHLEPEILVVDEVLAVGDAQFQKKCLGKMAEVAGIGRTVLLVSHQMPAITGLCSRVIVLQKGRVAFDGPTQQGVQFYLRSSDNAAPQSLAERTDRSGSGAIRFTSAWIEDEGGHPVDTVCSGQDVRLVITYTASAGHVVSSLTVAFALKDAMGGQLSDLWSEGTGAIWQQVAPEGTVVCRIPCLPLNAGRYSFNAIGRVNTIIADWLSDVATFDVVAGDFYGSGRIPDASQGQFLFQQTWTLE